MISSNIKIRFRQNKLGPESELIHSFLENVKVFLPPNVDYQIFKEAYAEIGIPDILIVVWEKNTFKKWPEERYSLNLIDIKIMHHIASCKKNGVTKESLSSQLGYTEKIVQSTIMKLFFADLILEEHGIVFPKKLAENFFISEIITIEAKISNLKKAISQAEINQNFSSRSYVLFPKKKINERVKAKFNQKIGLIGQCEEMFYLEKKADKFQIPGSYFSWVINEFIGRQLNNHV